MVISPYWTTTTKPYTTSTGGGEGDTTGSGNRWDWTLGLTQFNWLQSVLAGSSAKYKFVFSHQIVGGNSASSMVDYGHGGVDSATLVEWGGNDVGGYPLHLEQQPSRLGQPAHPPDDGSQRRDRLLPRARPPVCL